MTGMPKAEDAISLLVMGCGSIGERHIANLRAILPKARIDVFDSEPARLRAVEEKHKVNPVKEGAITEAYDCVLVCTPPVSHVKLAIQAVDAGSNVFIEKPLSTTLEGTKELQDLLHRKRLTAFVGYSLRFNKGINIIKKLIDDQKFGKVVHASAYFGQYLPDWRPSQDYRNSYTARKDLGGGIIFDASHEVDYLMWLLGKPVSIQSDYADTDIINVNTEAVADVIMKFQKNIQGHVHMNFVRREYKRTLEVLCENGIIQWSLSDQTVRTFDASSKSWTVLEAGQPVNDMYVDEMKHVIAMVRAKSRSPIIDLENGISTLQMSLAIHESGKSGKRIML
jgi:predicted dehydrogenase